MKRVTYFSAWHKPHHFIVKEEDLRDVISYGKERQYKVIVTDVNESEPTSF